MEAILIAALTGFRWNEVFGLRVSDADLRDRTVTVRRGLTRSKGASVPGRAGSRKARPRTEAIPDWLAEMLRDRIKRLAPTGGEALLFPDSNDGCVRYTNWRKRTWLPALEAAGLGKVVPRPGFHDLRRYHATALVADGVDVRTLMNRMGHKTAKPALEVSAQPNPDADRAAAEGTGARLYGAMSHVSRTLGGGEQQPRSEPSR